MPRGKRDYTKVDGAESAPDGVGLNNGLQDTRPLDTPAHQADNEEAFELYSRCMAWALVPCGALHISENELALGARPVDLPKWDEYLNLDMFDWVLLGALGATITASKSSQDLWHAVGLQDQIH